MDVRKRLRRLRPCPHLSKDTARKACKMRRFVQGGRLLAAVLIACVAFGVPAAALADDLATADPVEAQVEEAEPAEGEKDVEPRAAGVVYVSASGSDTDGTGSEVAPYASLAKAVKEAPDNGTIYLMGDITVTKSARFWDKSLTIDGQGHTVSRGRDMALAHESARDWYNPAMIEVETTSADGSSGHTLTLKNITLDDKGIHEGTQFVEQYTEAGTTGGNGDFVQDAIVSSHGPGCVIELQSDVRLLNYGGMSAIRVLNGAELRMGSGCEITDDATTAVDGFDRSDKNARGAVWVESGSGFEMGSGATIHDMVGRGVCVATGSKAEIRGTISDLTVAEAKSGAQMYEGAAVLSEGWGSVANVYGKIDAISAPSKSVGYSFRSNGGALSAQDGGVLNMHEGSLLSNVTGITAVFSRGGTGSKNIPSISINGTVKDCTFTDSNNGVIARANNGANLVIGPTGVITNCQGTSGIAVLYSMNNKAGSLVVEGRVENNTGRAVYLQGSPLEVKGSISNNTGDGIRVNNGSVCTINGGSVSNNGGTNGGVRVTGGSSQLIMNSGSIEGNDGPAVDYEVADNSLVRLLGGVIRNNARGGAQVLVDSGSAANSEQHAEIASGVVQGAATVDLEAFDVTLDADYDAIKLGNVSSAVATAIESKIRANHSDWTAACTGAVWVQPSTDEVRLSVPRTESMKNSGLYVTVYPLDENGEIPSGTTVFANHYLGTGNIDPVDITLEGLEPGRSYALMLFNNNEYTLAPDDITVYSGGGQGQDTSDSGFPMQTLVNCLDDIETLNIDGEEVESNDLMGELLELFTVSYADLDGNPVSNDSEPGEYVIKLEWAGGEEHKILINGNSVSPKLGTGTLTVRHTQNTDEAIAGTNTYPLVDEEPTQLVTNATAIAKESVLPSPLPTKFYTNDDEDREASAEGIQILDDDLLVDEDGTDRQELLEQKAVDSGILPALDEGRAYSYDFHYLDLVDAHNGNAWVSASYGTTVYLPYPDGMSCDEAKDITFTVVHYPGLHREYGISGQADVNAAIDACAPEVIESENTAAGIKFDVPREGFSPFAIVWQTEAHTITATAGEGGTVTPSGDVSVAEGDDVTFTFAPDDGYVIADVKVDGESVGKVDSYTFSDVTVDHTIEVAFEEEAVELPPHEHTWSDWKCDGEGHWKVCETCGAVSERADHAYGDWQKVSEATESEKGTWKRVCSVCGYVQYGETPVVEPDDAEIPQTGDATNATLPVLLAVSGIAVAIGVIVFRRRSGL